MNEQEFLATLKLVSGEEVISMVLYLEDEDKVLLSNPFLVEQSKQRQGQLEVVGFSFKEWVMASFDDMYIISRDHIITITCLLYTSPSPRDSNLSRMPSSA